MKDEQEQQKTFKMTDDQRKRLDQQFSHLQSLYMQVGGKFCELTDFAVTNVMPARQAMGNLQDEICASLGVPRNNETRWYIDKGEVVVVSREQPEQPEQENSDG